MRAPRLVFVPLLLLAVHSAAQPDQPALPFALGETLRYRAVSSRFGSFGTGAMRVEGPEPMRGTRIYRLGFEFHGRVGPFKVRDHTQSWLDPERMLSLRYRKQERSPLGSRDEAVEIYPDERRWTSGAGEAGQTPTQDPLDELSFLYFIRTLPLEEGAVHTLERHFDVERNPVVVRVLRRERVRVPAGEFATVVVEMHVSDKGRFGGNGSLRLYLTDDARRVPVEIQTSFPGVGTVRLLLEQAD